MGENLEELEFELALRKRVGVAQGRRKIRWIEKAHRKVGGDYANKNECGNLGSFVWQALYRSFIIVAAKEQDALIT